MIWFLHFSYASIGVPLLCAQYKISLLFMRVCIWLLYNVYKIFSVRFYQSKQVSKSIGGFTIEIEIHLYIYRCLKSFSISSTYIVRW